MRIMWVQLLAGLLALQPFQAHAENAETVADVRCLIVALRLVNSRDSSQQNAGNMAFLYYVGRLDGRAPGLDIEQLVADEIESMTPADLRSEANRCGTALVDKGQKITVLGQHLAERGRKILEKGSTEPK